MAELLNRLTLYAMYNGEKLPKETYEQFLERVVLALLEDETEWVKKSLDLALAQERAPTE